MILGKGYAQILQENEAYPEGLMGKKKIFYQTEGFNLVEIVIVVTALQVATTLMQTSQIVVFNLLSFEQ